LIYTRFQTVIVILLIDQAGYTSIEKLKFCSDCIQSDIST